MADRTVGDYGQSVTVTVTGKDPSAAASAVLKVRKPGGLKVSWTATSTTSTTASYTLAAGDLDVPGTYTVSLLLTYSSPAESIYTSEDTFTVKAAP